MRSKQSHPHNHCCPLYNVSKRKREAIYSKQRQVGQTDKCALAAIDQQTASTSRNLTQGSSEGKRGAATELPGQNLGGCHDEIFVRWLYQYFNP